MKSHPMPECDFFQRFMFVKRPVRGLIVRLSESYRTIIEKQAYPPEVERLLAQALIAVIVLSGLNKSEGSLTLQFRGDGPISLISVRCTEDLGIRGLVKYDESLEYTEEHIAQSFSRGLLALIYQPSSKVRGYESVVEFNGGSLASSIEHFFEQSEQLKTRLIPALADGSCAGLFLQAMPDEAGEDFEEHWAHITALAQTIESGELLELSTEAILHRLYHEDDVSVFPADRPNFNCNCSETKMAQAVRMLGEDEAQQIIDEHKEIEVTCEFCGHSFSFDSIEVMRIFDHGIVGDQDDQRH